MRRGRGAWDGSPYGFGASNHPGVDGLSQKGRGKSIKGGGPDGAQTPALQDVSATAGGLEVQGLQVSSERIGQVGTGQGEFDGGLEESQFLAGVVTLALELDGIDGPSTAQHAQTIGELDLSPGVRRRVLEDGEKIGRQHVAADDGQIRWRVPGVRLLYQIAYIVHISPETARGDDAVTPDFLARDAHDGQHRAPVALEDVEELAHARHARHDDVVAEEDAEGLVADQGPRAEDGVTQSERLLLAHIGHRGQLRDRLDLGQLFQLAAVLKIALELVGRVEMI